MGDLTADYTDSNRLIAPAKPYPERRLVDYFLVGEHDKTYCELRGCKISMRRRSVGEGRFAIASMSLCFASIRSRPNPRLLVTLSNVMPALGINRDRSSIR